MNDFDYMQQALALAAKGAGRVSPNPLVGAVVVREGHIVGEGYHQAVGGPHAEVHALEAAGDAARGATLYVTLEPCNHHGRTPPCTRKIIACGIARVVSAMTDPNPNVAGGGHAALRAQGIEVQSGLCESAARRLNESFIKFIQTGRPFVVLKLAATLDGRIAARTGDARWVTGPAARERVHRLRHALDAIMVGVGTVLADDPRLTARLPEGGGVDPMRIVLDSRLRMRENARMLSQDSDARTYIVCGPGSVINDRRRLEAAGAHILEVPIEDGGGIDLPALVERLGDLGVTSLLIEGGARVAGSALAAGIVDKVVFHYAPKILGGGDGVPMLRGPGPDRMQSALDLSAVTIERLGEDIAVEGYLNSKQ